MALELRPACERCARTLPVDSTDAWICTHECTFCTACTAALDRACPNCSGELVRRPRRGVVPATRRMLQAHARTTWTGNLGEGTASYRAYGRSHELSSGTKAPIAGSSDPAFRGAAERWNPEELLVGSIAACHMLWYLHLCAEAGMVVTDYVDDAEATLHEATGGDGRIVHATLRPQVTIAAGSDAAAARALHAVAHERCFVANATTVPLTIAATIVTS
jgi:organic hydroperoxide reductase OsmC/OhrA